MALSPLHVPQWPLEIAYGVDEVIDGVMTDDDGEPDNLTTGEVRFQVMDRNFNGDVLLTKLLSLGQITGDADGNYEVFITRTDRIVFENGNAHHWYALIRVPASGPYAGDWKLKLHGPLTIVGTSVT